MAMAPDAALPLMHVAACAWVLGFAAFLLAYAPMLGPQEADPDKVARAGIADIVGRVAGRVRGAC